jgi:hypothetical protein
MTRAVAPAYNLSEDDAMDDRRELIRNDPESEQTFDGLVEVVAEELFVRASMGDQIKSPDDAKHFAEIAVDAVLDRFSVRERDADHPRYSWRGT